MGGTGALQFCGINGLQLVVSRRNQDLLGQSLNSRDQEWGFTVVRRIPPTHETRNSVFMYLAPVGANVGKPGSVLSFAEDALPIFAESSQAVTSVYYRESSYGSLVKLYEYRLRGSASRSNILLREGLLRRIETALPEIALPVRLYECREGYRSRRSSARSFATNARGLVARLERDRAANLELDPFGCEITVGSRKIRIRVFVFKPDASRQYRSQKYGVIFTINGQTHGSLRTDFFRRRRVGMSYLAESLLVIVDCTEIDGTMREDLFMNSRDRLRENSLSVQIEEELEVYLRNNPTLREIRNRRQEAARKEKLEDDKPLIEALESVLRSEPTISRVLLRGLGLASPFATGGGAGKGRQSEFVGRRFPTFFRFAGMQTGEDLVRDANLGSRVRVSFETDAMGDYFSREVDAGSCDVSLGGIRHPGWTAVSTMTDPALGVAQLWIEGLPDGVRVGEELSFVVRISDTSRVDPFINNLRLRIRGPQTSGGGGSGRNSSKNSGDGSSGGQDSLNLPNIRLVRQDEWDKYELNFHEESVLGVRNTPAENGNGGEQESYEYDFFVNVDNKYLLIEQKAQLDNSELIERQFTYGMVIVGLALLRQDSERGNGKSAANESQADRRPDDRDIETLINETTAGLAPVFLPMLKVIGTLVQDEL